MKKWIAVCFSFYSGILLSQEISTDVLVVGGGTSGTAAGIQAARLGAKVIIAEPTTWLGGMISAAGVTATDGNHKLPSGIWGEFRNQIYKVYGGPAKVETGWVSNTLFEPKVSDSIWKSMAKQEPNLTIMYKCFFEKTLVKKNNVIGAMFTNFKNDKIIIKAKIVIDATEMGDVMASAKIPYSLGMESEKETGEKVGVPATNDIVQDLTYVAILQDYGKGVDKTIAKPANYNPLEFDGACTDYYIDTTQKKPSVNSEKMLQYGKLPNNKYMINWPNKGNDTYLNIVEMNRQERQKALEEAKQTTLRFVYFIQQQLGFKHLGLAENEFDTDDKLAIVPYIREGRRVKGLVRFDINHIAKPFENAQPLYRTGIAVADYPIDHHHKKNLKAPQHLDFFAVPSYNIPIGALIPQNMDGIIIAEKGISVSNVVNGSTRLQPAVIQIGQAAGAIAALSVSSKTKVKNLSVRKVQSTLLNAQVYLMPYIDVPVNHLYFSPIQRIGATGLIKGKGLPYKWANQTWFYPDSNYNSKAFAQASEAMYNTKYIYKTENVSFFDLVNFILKIKSDLSKQSIKDNWPFGKMINEEMLLSRTQIAYLMDFYLNPFLNFPVDFDGSFKPKR